jgi:gamma-glutamyltranspeptidase/glutathione hydrolase
MRWDHGYPTVRHPVFGRSAVATSQPLAAAAGLRILREGGNAVDAALATAIALTVVEPCSNGIGSDAFAIIWDGSQLHGLNASGRAPQAWTPEYFATHEAMPLFGWDAITVPGAVSAWMEMSARFGRLPFAQLFAPAIEYARDGFLVTPLISRRWAFSHERLKDRPGFSAVFSDNGRTPGEGAVWRLPAHARGLQAIADSGGEAFYRGEIAEAIIASARAHGGAMTLDDLAAHRADWVGTISTEYEGHQVHEIPPNGQGIAALIALGILRHLDIADMDPDSPESQHLQIEAVKVAFADAYRYVGDPSTSEFDPEYLLQEEYLAARARLIEPSRAQEFMPGEPPRSGTVYLTAADSDGMMVSMIQSNYMGFGSGVVEPTYGISLQNRGNGFVLTPGHPNRVGPGKRPFHTIIPGFLMKDGRAQMSFGVMGGHMQPQGHAQTLVRMLTYGMNPQAACDAPRFRWNSGFNVNLEDTFPASTKSRLLEWGHQLADRNDSSVDFGSGQFIWALKDGYVSATDPRSGGLALTY